MGRVMLGCEVVLMSATRRGRTYLPDTMLVTEGVRRAGSDVRQSVAVCTRGLTMARALGSTCAWPIGGEDASTPRFTDMAKCGGQERCRSSDQISDRDGRGLGETRPDRGGTGVGIVRDGSHPWHAKTRLSAVRVCS